MRAASLCILALVVAIVVGVSGDQQSREVAQGDFNDRVRKSERIVVATIQGVESGFDINEFGDQLIFSIATLRVDETLKGRPERELTVRVEGGTVGDLTLDVSDVPTVEAGERAVFLLDSTPAGSHVPHDRGHGIIKIVDGDRIEGADMTLEDVRAAVLALVP
jgi:hypothetical protein